MNAQTTIQGDQLNPPQENVSCEWCGAPSIDSLPIMRRVPGRRGGRTPTGMRVYFCGPHRDVAERSVAEPAKPS